MTLLGHVSHITILGYTMIGHQDVRLTERLSQTNKGYSIFKNNITSTKSNRNPVNIVCK